MFSVPTPLAIFHCLRLCLYVYVCLFVTGLRLKNISCLIYVPCPWLLQVKTMTSRGEKVHLFTIKCDDVCSICRGGVHRDDVQCIYGPGFHPCWLRMLKSASTWFSTGTCNRSHEKNPVAANFNILSHSTDDLSNMVIEKMKCKYPNHRKKKESYCSQSPCPAGDEPGPVDLYGRPVDIFMYTTSMYAVDIFALDG